jgi:hypothetical protein
VAALQCPGEHMWGAVNPRQFLLGADGAVYAMLPDHTCAPLDVTGQPADVLESMTWF